MEELNELFEKNNLIELENIVKEYKIYIKNNTTFIFNNYENDYIFNNDFHDYIFKNLYKLIIFDNKNEKEINKNEKEIKKEKINEIILKSNNNYEIKNIQKNIISKYVYFQHFFEKETILNDYDDLEITIILKIIHHEKVDLRNLNYNQLLNLYNFFNMNLFLDEKDFIIIYLSDLIDENNFIDMLLIYSDHKNSHNDDFAYFMAKIRMFIKKIIDYKVIIHLITNIPLDSNLFVIFQILFHLLNNFDQNVLSLYFSNNLDLKEKFDFVKLKFLD
jgi:hypothetical protein